MYATFNSLHSFIPGISDEFIYKLKFVTSSVHGEQSQWYLV